MPAVRLPKPHESSHLSIQTPHWRVYYGLPRRYIGRCMDVEGVIRTLPNMFEFTYN